MFLFWAFLSYVEGSARTCPDQELGELCESQCRLDFIACRDNCTDSLCDNQCLITFTDCVSFCPCFDGCPDGCLNCSHPLCFCKDPEINNPTYKQCIDEASSALKYCMNSCKANNDCFNGCHEDFLLSSSKCPCMSSCPGGCPCEEGYHCQPFMTALCEQNEATLRYNYIISADGHFKENRFYRTPATSNNNYLSGVGTSILHGIVYIFGGHSDSKKIAKINDCGIEELSVRLLNGFQDYGTLVTVPTSPDEIMLCSGSDPYTKCEDFDGQISRNNEYILTHEHKWACLALDNNFPTIIGGGDYSTNNHNNKVESLGLSGWRAETDHPVAHRCMGCVSVENGLVTVGGHQKVGEANITLKSVYLYRNKIWTFAGELQQATGLSTMLFYGTHMFSFSGWTATASDDGFAVERLAWNGTFITEAAIINVEDQVCYNPVVFETSPDACVDSCSEYCFN